MKNTKNITTISLFIGIVVVLQLVATFINFGGFPITLTLVPIIIGGAMYGKKVGAILGTAFGVVVALMVVTGADASGAYMLSVHPFITVAGCILKGTFAGLFSALVYEKLKDKNQTLAIVLAAAIAPITNTGILTLIIIIWFQGSFATFIALFLTLNFALELIIDILLAPSLLRVINQK